MSHSITTPFGRVSSEYDHLSDDKAKALEQYAYHTRLGNFHAAEKIWTYALSSEPANFAIVVGRVECLSKQSRYGDISSTVQRTLDNEGAAFTTKQARTLHLYLAYSKIFTHRSLRYAIEQAQAVVHWLAPIDSVADAEIEVRCMSFSR